MKSSTAYLLSLFLGANQAIAEGSCVEGHRVEISQGYTVEYKCDVYREGVVHRNIGSERECAKICRDADLSVCSYHEGLQRCVAGNENGQDFPSPGVVYMQRVDNDPFRPDPSTPDPFSPDVDTAPERDACLQREAALIQENSAVQNQLYQCYIRNKEFCSTGKPNPQQPFPVGGKSYRVWCGAVGTGANEKMIPGVSSLYECMNHCSTASFPCVQAVYNTNDNKCYLKKTDHRGTPKIAGVFQTAQVL